MLQRDKDTTNENSENEDSKIEDLKSPCLSPSLFLIISAVVKNRKDKEQLKRVRDV